MESTWIASPPPKPSLAELRRVISTEPVKVTLTFTPGIYPRVSVVFAIDSDVWVVGKSAAFSVSSVVFEELACTLDRLSVSFKQAAHELREGPKP